MTDQTPDSPDSTPKGPLGRLRRLSGRAKLFVAVGLVLVVIAVTRSCQGVDITEEEAVATARTALAAEPGAFEPARTEAKILRQGFPPDAMWVVVFTVPDPEGGSEDFLRHAAIWVDGRSGEVRQVEVAVPPEP